MAWCAARVSPDARLRQIWLKPAFLWASGPSNICGFIRVKRPAYFLVKLKYCAECLPCQQWLNFDKRKQQGLLLGRLHCQLIILFYEFLLGCAWHNGEHKGGIDESQAFNHEDCFEAEEFIFFCLTTFYNTRKQTHLAHPNHILISDQFGRIGLRIE